MWKIRGNSTNCRKFKSAASSEGATGCRRSGAWHWTRSEARRRWLLGNGSKGCHSYGDNSGSSGQGKMENSEFQKTPGPIRATRRFSCRDVSAPMGFWKGQMGWQMSSFLPKTASGGVIPKKGAKHGAAETTRKIKAFMVKTKAIPAT